MSKRVHIELTEAEALLIFEGLSLSQDKLVLADTLSDEMLTALSGLICELEKKLPVLESNYFALLEQAKQELRIKE